MNLANQLTVLRMLLSLAMFAALMFQSRYLHLAALAFYIAAVITDWFDGYVARKTNT
ncbi:MAG: CDP-alcohol phosphatidyltransferase family protein, partial [Elusimicrobiota bacterium]